VQSLEPENYIQLVTAEEIAVLLWRRRRIVNYERADGEHVIEFRRQLARAENVSVPAQPTLDALASIPDGKALEKIIACEPHTRRELAQALHRFERLKAPNRISRESVVVLGVGQFQNELPAKRRRFRKVNGPTVSQQAENAPESRSLALAGLSRSS
jgi:hypothetical protein